MVNMLMRWVLLVGLYALVVFSCLEPQGDTDIWWHLATGRWIVQHHALPFTDPFTSFRVGQRWYAYSWLFELVVYGLYCLAGVAGIVLYTIVMSTLIATTMLGLIRKFVSNWTYSVGLTALGMLGMMNVLSPRPWLVTILLLLLELRILLSIRDGGRPQKLLWLLPIFILWANVHIQFFIGLAVLVVFALEPLGANLLHWLGVECETPGTHGKWTGFIVAGAFLATLVNPYGTGVYAVIAEIASQHNVPFAAIMELQAPSFRSLPDWISLGIILMAVFFLGRAHPLSLWWVLLLVAGVLLYFRAARDVWFPVSVAMLILAQALGRTQLPSQPKPERYPAGLYACVLLGVGLVVLVTGKWQFLSNSVLETKLAERFPLAASDYIEQKHLAGHIFNHFDWGGYLIWRFPDARITLDGRTNLHGEERLLRIGQTWSAGPKWREDPELQAATLIVAPTKMSLTSVLQLDSRFQVLYESKVAVVLEKR